MARKQLNRWDSDKFFGFSNESGNFSDIVFEFLAEQEESPKADCDSYDYMEGDEDDIFNVEENKKFWETQNELLQATLYRISSLEMKIRQATKDAIRDIQDFGMQCACNDPVIGECRNCLQREISLRLQTEGYNSAICKSKWKSSPEIPSGEHTFLEVIDKSNSKKGEIRIIIELNFRAQFEMARANEEYNQLINRLPEIFVGKAERLKALVKILCSSGKKCMKDNKMHLGPWRKHKYVQSKWFGTCDRTMVQTPLPVGSSDRPAKPRASMLTYDMLDYLPVLHCTAVKVL